jgi:hypothetical protein
MRQVRAEVHFTVNIDEEDGCYWAEVVEIPGCFVWGRSREEIRAALVEAIHATMHSAGPQVVLRDLESVVGGVMPPPARRGPSPSGRQAAGRVLEHPVLTAAPAEPITPDAAAGGGEADAPIADLVSLAGRRPLQS